MHIAEGILSGPVLGAGAVATGIGVAVGLRRLSYEEIPRTAVMASVFFVVSLVRIPVGGGSVHLLLIGLTGLLLGWAAFPAILIGLVLQAQLFGFGGLTTLGVNTLNMALPAVACHFLFRHLVRRSRPVVAAAWAGIGAGLATLAACALLSASLLLAGREFHLLVKLVVIAHLPVVVVEAVVTGAVISFLKRVRPDILSEGVLLHAPQELR